MSSALIWFAVGLVLMLLEMALPAVVLVFIGLGAWVTAFAVWMGWVDSVMEQSLLFGVASMALLVGLRRVFKGWLVGRLVKDAVPSNLEEFLGKVVAVVAAIPEGGTGKVEFKGAQWNAQSPVPLETGAAAIITGREGLCLLVRPK